MTIRDFSLELYDGTTRLSDPYRVLDQATDLSFSTGYPGGLFLDCGFRLPVVPRGRLPFQPGHKFKVRRQDRVIWEGRFTDPIYSRDEIGVRLIGEWGHVMMRRHWYKWWADERITDSVWVYDETAASAEVCFVDRNDRIRFTPKAEAWTNGEIAQVVYTAPTGTTIDRIEYDYDFADNSGAETWSLIIRDITNASDEVTISTQGSATGQSNDFSPVSSQIAFRFVAGANQTPSSDGSTYGEFSNITVYATFEGSTAGTEGTLNVAELCYDTIDFLSGDISASTAFVDSALTEDLRPFITERPEKVADVLTRAAGFGDTSTRPVAVGLKPSDQGPDDLPVLFAETYQQLDDYEYVLSWSSPNRVGGSLSRNASEIANYLWVVNTDDLGRTVVQGPGDSSSLEDTYSQGLPWGQLERVIRMPHSDSTIAAKWGAAYLDRAKDVQWQVVRPLTVVDYIENKQRARVPVSRIRAGERIKITDFADGDNIFVITHTTYNASRNRVAIRAGIPEMLIDPRMLRTGV